MLIGRNKTTTLMMMVTNDDDGEDGLILFSATMGTGRLKLVSIQN